MATHSGILAWRIPWTEEPGRLQSIVSQRPGHDWSELAHNTLLLIRRHFEKGQACRTESKLNRNINIIRSSWLSIMNLFCFLSLHVMNYVTDQMHTAYISMFAFNDRDLRTAILWSSGLAWMYTICWSALRHFSCIIVEDTCCHGNVYQVEHCTEQIIQ